MAIEGDNGEGQVDGTGVGEGNGYQHPVVGAQRLGRVHQHEVSVAGGELDAAVRRNGDPDRLIMPSTPLLVVVSCIGMTSCATLLVTFVMVSLELPALVMVK